MSFVQNMYACSAYFQIKNIYLNNYECMVKDTVKYYSTKQSYTTATAHRTLRPVAAVFN